ncbi:MAG: hypothetical protein GXP33_10880 [Spirochaetes bacterium]|nr:hypothetical protein [Spirochaetota bacterium]
MSTNLVKRLYEGINEFPIFDPHTHINPQNPSAGSLGGILSYHYYTELCNSAEYDPGWWEEGISPDLLVKRIAKKLPLIHNTVQFSWFLTIADEFIGIPRTELLNPENLERLNEKSKKVMSEKGYIERLIEKSGIKRVYLTNQFYEKLEGFDCNFYRPCLRIDPFSYFADRETVLKDMSVSTGVQIKDSSSFDKALDRVFARFKEKNFAYASVSSWPGTKIHPVENTREDAVIKKILSGERLSCHEHEDHVAYSFLLVAELCRKYDVPFHLMIGVDKDVYSQGVQFGTDLVDSNNSMRGYDYLFNQFPDVRFPTSVLSDTQGLELTSSAWIRHNIFPSGHWWYLNNPTDIAREVSRRLEVVPLQKIIGYYSDAYYLEFILPKFRMYKYTLAQVLAEKIEASKADPNMLELTGDKALETAWDILFNNPQRIFKDTTGQ